MSADMNPVHETPHMSVPLVRHASAREAAAPGSTREVQNRVPVHVKAAERSDEDTEGVIRNATEQLNNVMETFGKTLRFRMHESTSEMYVQVVDAGTDEVVKTIPSEEMLDVIARMHEVIGMLVDVEG